MRSDRRPLVTLPFGQRRRGRPRSGERLERGMVTAETAVALPAMVVLAASLLWGLVAAGAQIRCVDAARAGARAAARGDTDAVTVARAAAPSGASVEIVQDGADVRVTVTAPCPGPGRLGAALSVRLEASAVAAREDAVGAGGGEETPWPE